MRLPDDVIRDVFPWDEFALAQSLVGRPADGDSEDDLFAGVRASDVDEPVDTLPRRS